MSEYRAISSQDEMDEIIAWYRRALGVDHWRIQAKFQDADMAEDNHGQCETWPNHPNAIISLQMPADQLRWREHLDDEETVVHEMVHLVVQPHYSLMMTAVETIASADLRATFIDLLHDDLERLVTLIARALVALARADRTGPSPQIGAMA